MSPSRLFTWQGAVLGLALVALLLGLWFAGERNVVAAVVAALGVGAYLIVRRGKGTP